MVVLLFRKKIGIIQWLQECDPTLILVPVNADEPSVKGLAHVEW